MAILGVCPASPYTYLPNSRSTGHASTATTAHEHPVLSPTFRSPGWPLLTSEPLTTTLRVVPPVLRASSIARRISGGTSSSEPYSLPPTRMICVSETVSDTVVGNPPSTTRPPDLRSAISGPGCDAASRLTACSLLSPDCRASISTIREIADSRLAASSG